MTYYEDFGLWTFSIRRTTKNRVIFGIDIWWGDHWSLEVSVGLWIVAIESKNQDIPF